MSALDLLINCRMVRGDQTFAVVSPAAEQVIAECSRASERQFDEAVAAAKAAFPVWSEAPIA